ncbi:MAG: phosphonate ABC transporter, permease protein PhnE [Capsulimonadales bacterium]|nr:phosphonate ABC transporter, permease protein PhnE [Capsulimonadales bacterium]
MSARTARPEVAETEIPRPPFPWQGWIAAVAVVGLLWWSSMPPPIGTGFNLREVVEGWPQMQVFFQRLFPTPDRPWPLDYLPQIVNRMTETLKIATAASIFGAVFALPFAMLAARNLAAGRIVYGFGRGLLNLIRTIPDLVLAALLASAFGIGPLPGVLALTIFTFGVVAKLLSDTIETVDPGPQEAITAAGGNRIQQALFAVFPQVAPDFVAYSLYAFEVNIRAAAFLGYVGAGGIGMILNRDVKFFNYGRVGLIITTIFVTVLIIDTVSTTIRRRLV